MSFWDLLKPAPTKAKGAAALKPATAAELRDALAQAEAEAASTEQAAAEIAQERAIRLIAASDIEIDEIDRRLQLSQRAADRSAAAVEALRTRVAEAEGAERAASLDWVYQSGADALDRGRSLYAEYGNLAHRLAEVVGQLPALAAEIERANQELREAGDPRWVHRLDEHVRPELSAVRVLRTELWHGVRLPAADHPQSMIFPFHVAPDVPPLPVTIPGESSEPAPKPREPGAVQW